MRVAIFYHRRRAVFKYSNRSGDRWDCPQNCGNVRTADVATIRGLPLYVDVEVFDLGLGAMQM
jgi:hypothetical protein